MLALHFVELYFEAAGARVFSVVVNGEEKISGLDMFAQAGVHIMIGSFAGNPTWKCNQLQLLQSY